MVFRVNDCEMFQALVAAGVGVGFLPRLALHPLHPGVVIKAVEGSPRRRILAVTLPAMRSRASAAFLEMLNTYGVHRRRRRESWESRGSASMSRRTTSQAELADAGVNSMRAFPRQGIRVWGARTLSSDPEWRRVPVRRVFLHLASSIEHGTRWTVFEPNGERLWEALREQVEHYLERSWRDGALAGETADDAYYVKCDAETNRPEVIEAGQVVCEIGIAPVKPREFAILRLSRIAADARRRESAKTLPPA